jgi:hypothetical protein
MVESVNADVAQELSDRNDGGGHKQRWEQVAEVIEVLFLAVVATTTAWSGYQAAKWDGRESAFYQDATRDRFRAEAASTLGGLELVSDSALFTAWLQARADHDPALAQEFVGRFTPDFRKDFDAWLETDGTGAAAEQDVGFMPGYARNPHVEEATRLNTRSEATFIKGKEANAVADKYVRNTVLLATVLFLIAIAQRFPTRGFRIGVNAGAFLLLVYVVVSTATLPRLS